LDLISAYATNNPEELSTVITKHLEVFNRDTNTGLVKQVQLSMFKKNIQRLTKTFLTLSLADVAVRVSMSSAKEAETYILRMIEDGEIYAAINQKDGMVVFLDNPEKYNSAKMFRKLEDEMKACMSSDDKLRLMDQEIALNPKYIQKTRTENE
jgi:COP9 signalosome complex subunit 3